MSITDPWVLPQGTIITPIESLPAKLREQVQGRDGDFTISRPNSRTPSRILDSQSAALLKEFESPKTIAQAIAYYSRATGSDPERSLEGALPMLTRMIAWRLLVPPGSREAEEIRASFHNGTTVAQCEVLQCIQALEDSEIYQVRRPDGEICALKILRRDSGAQNRPLEREAAILRRLAGSVSPALLNAGIWNDCAYLLLEWCPGVDASTAAAGLHSDRSAAAKALLLTLCKQILRAYSRLHAEGVIHSDVHPRNIMVDEGNRIKLVDFGLARQESVNLDFGEPTRGGIGFFFEPEYAVAVGRGQEPPAASQLGEQYGLAALLYSLLAGAHYLDFSLAKEEMMRQIAEDPPLSFVQRKMAAWPAVEDLLAKALSKDPSARFASISEFADALDGVEIAEDDQHSGMPGADLSILDGVLDRSLARVGFSGDLVRSGLVTPPRASVTYGAAGIAYALYRIACQRQDSRLLSLADVWSRRAASDPENSESYYNAEIEITPEIVGSISPYHTLSGVHAVRALVSHALCDVSSQAAALEAFIAASKSPCDNLDLALGRSGTLLITSLLLDTVGDKGILTPAPLLEFGNRMLESIWREIDEQPPLRAGTRITYLGIAHGWAGILYSTIVWHNSSGAKLPAQVEERLRQLIECAQPWGRGIRWPWTVSKGTPSSTTYMPGWCNGSAGYIFLWTAAHRIFHDDAYLQFAERAAWHAWESNDSISNLCCGLAGAAYGLLNLYKYTGESLWLDRARDLACRAAGWDANDYAALKMEPASLYKGEMGVALLAADLCDPKGTCMPLFEPEGWPAGERSRPLNSAVHE